jgi:hypothetical protein
MPAPLASARASRRSHAAGHHHAAHRPYLNVAGAQRILAAINVATVAQPRPSRQLMQAQDGSGHQRQGARQRYHAHGADRRRGVQRQRRGARSATSTQQRLRLRAVQLVSNNTGGLRRPRRDPVRQSLQPLRTDQAKIEQQRIEAEEERRRLDAEREAAEKAAADQAAAEKAAAEKAAADKAAADAKARVSAPTAGATGARTSAPPLPSSTNTV